MSDTNDDIRSEATPISSVSNRTFEVIDIDVAQERLWLRPMGSHKHIAGNVDHVDPDTDTGRKLSSVEEGDYITCSMTRYQWKDDMIPFWCIEDASRVREPQGSERNVLE